MTEKPVAESPKLLHEKLPAADGAFAWFAGWYATRLHCIKIADTGGTDSAGRAVCGAWCYEKPKTSYAARLLAKGVQRCKHCERIVAGG
jgi:hypothetical protein